MTDVTLDVSGMKCDGCADSVEEALESVAGVDRVEVSLDREEARVAVERSSPEELVAAVEDAGFSARLRG